MDNDILSCYVKFCVNRKTNFASVKETVILAHFAVACSLFNSIFSEVIKILYRRLFITSAPCKRGSQPTFGQAELSSRKQASFITINFLCNSFFINFNIALAFLTKKVIMDTINL